MPIVNAAHGGGMEKFEKSDAIPAATKPQVTLASDFVRRILLQCERDDSGSGSQVGSINPLEHATDRVHRY